jgi:hypothetical protein
MTDFCTIDQVVDYLQTRSTVSLDVPLLADVLIPDASDFIREQTADDFVSASYTSIRDGVGESVFFPTYVMYYRPITAVAAVSVNGIALAPAAPPYAVIGGAGLGGGSGFSFTDSSVVLYGVRVPRIPGCVVIQYTAGPASIPGDINLLCIELVAQKYRYRTRGGIASESVSGVGARTYTTADLNATQLKTLARRLRSAPVPRP